MAPDPLAPWYRHPVIVQRVSGTGAYGDTFAAPAVELAAVSNKRNLVLDANGSQVISETTLALASTTADIPPRSRVTLPAEFGDRTTVVISTARGDGGGQPTPDHLEVSLR